MNGCCELNDVTRRYLAAYCGILEEMIQGMTKAELTDSISHNFIVQMIPHHRAAIEMSKNILKYTENEQVREIASGIITEQTKSIENMCEVKDRCSACINSGQDVCMYQRRVERILQTMFCRMKNAYANNCLNCDFMWEMIPHHEGAVQMGTNAFEYTICSELHPIIQAIITSQRRGILQMEGLLQQLCCRR